MNLLKRIFLFVALALIVSIISLVQWGCKGKDEPFANIPPIVRLSNVPPPSLVFTSTNPRLTLYWKGDDPDGFIIAFKYRWTYPINGVKYYRPWTTILNTGVLGNTQSNFVLVLDTTIQNSQAIAPSIYRYFTTLDPSDIAFRNSLENVLDAGDTLVVTGVRIFASNPSTVRFPAHENPNSGTFIFDSQDSLNFHTFEICAIDNNGEVGPIDSIRFNTLRIPLPRTIVAPGFKITDTMYVLEKFTDTWGCNTSSSTCAPGIIFTFAGIDPNSRLLQYSWNVDSVKNLDGTLRWSPWSEDVIARVTASDFAPASIYATNHILSARSRNEFGSIDTAGFFSHNCDTLSGICETTYASQRFDVIYPPFKRTGYTQRILLLNASKGWKPPAASVSYPSYSMLDSYYDSVFTSLGKTFDIWHVSGQGVPPRTIFSKYSVVYFYADTYDTSDGSYFKKIDTSIALSKAIKEYCLVGGKVIFSSWNLLTFLNRVGTPDYLTIMHIKEVTPFEQQNIFSQPNNDFDKAIGDASKGYPDAVLNQQKLDTSWHGTLGNIEVVTPKGFGEVIYRYHSSGQDTTVIRLLVDGRIMGVRYKGLTYDVIYFGFPLYFIEKNNAIAILNRALSDIGE